MVEVFRQSYARDLQDFLKLREQQLNASEFQKVELAPDDSKYFTSDGFRDSVP